MGIKTDIKTMDIFHSIYKILAALEATMDISDLDTSLISADALKISQERWARYIEMLADNGYIKGVKVAYNILGETSAEIGKKTRITLKGLEYLQENSIMQHFYRAAHGISETVGNFM